MRNSLNFYIPKKDDWSHLERVYKRLNSVNSSNNKTVEQNNYFKFNPPFLPFKKKGFFLPNISDDYMRLSRLISYFARYFWDSCPIPFISIITKKQTDYIFENVTAKDIINTTINDEIEDLSTIFQDSLDRTGFMRLLNQIEDEGLVTSMTYKSWIKKYGESARIRPELKSLIAKGNSNVYPLTGLGTLFYEYCINAPAMFLCYESGYFLGPVNNDTSKEGQYSKNHRSTNRYNTSTYPLIFLSYAIREKRLTLFKDSFFQYKQTSSFHFHGYHEEVCEHQEQILGNDYSFFTEIHNPASKILREIRCLYELADRNQLPLGLDFSSRDSNPDLLSKKLLAKKINYEVNFLYEIWVDFLKLDESLISRHLPENPI